jgi:hypothetical protein
MTTTIAGVVDKPVDAQRLVDELVSGCLCDRSDISLMARDAVADGRRQGAQTVKKALDANADAAKVVISWLSQGLESVTRSIPGGGMVRGFGSLAARLADAGVTTAAQLAKALVDLGVPKDEARYYGEAFEGGGIVVTVHARTDNIARCARQTMMKYGAISEEAASAAAAR